MLLLAARKYFLTGEVWKKEYLGAFWEPFGSHLGAKVFPQACISTGLVLPVSDVWDPTNVDGSKVLQIIARTQGKLFFRMAYLGP